MGIVGPNGAGKTTLAYILAGILTPDSGMVDTHGLRVGLVLSNPQNQIVSLVVEEDIAFGPENMGLSSKEIASRIEYALCQTHSQDLRDAMTSGISGGQLAKVVFSGQLAMDTDVFVLDEGTVMLDPVNRRILLDTVCELNEVFGKTIIHITHRLDDLERADTLITLVDTRIHHHAHGTYSLFESGGLPRGVEAGSVLKYRRFLRGHGIDEGDLKAATGSIARLMSLGGTHK